MNGKCENLDRQTDRQYYTYLNGLKGIACLFIMVGHYLGLYKYAQSFIPSIQVIDKINHSLFSFLIDEGYWLYLFFVVSGYLISKSHIQNVSDLLTKSVNRFFRLAFPILFSYLVIFVIYRLLGFHAADTSDLFECKWFQGFYLGAYSLYDVFLSPIFVLILGKATLNSPYWVLRMMFISSLLIYLLKYLCVKLKSSEHEAFAFSALITITLLSVVISPIITACLIGFLLSYYENMSIRNTPYYAFWFIFIAMSLYILPKTLISSIFFASLVIFVPRLKLINNILSSKPFQFLGNISWGIYSFHWPIICSVGAISIISLSAHAGLIIAYCGSFFVSLLLTIILSVFFLYSFERFSKELTKNVSILFAHILSRNIHISKK